MNNEEIERSGIDFLKHPFWLKVILPHLARCEKSALERLMLCDLTELEECRATVNAYRELAELPKHLIDVARDDRLSKADMGIQSPSTDIGGSDFLEGQTPNERL